MLSQSLGVSWASRILTYESSVLKPPRGLENETRGWRYWATSRTRPRSSTVDPAVSITLCWAEEPKTHLWGPSAEPPEPSEPPQPLSGLKHQILNGMLF